MAGPSRLLDDSPACQPRISSAGFVPCSPRPRCTSRIMFAAAQEGAQISAIVARLDMHRARPPRGHRAWWPVIALEIRPSAVEVQRHVDRRLRSFDQQPARPCMPPPRITGFTSKTVPSTFRHVRHRHQPVFRPNRVIIACGSRSPVGVAPRPISAPPPAGSRGNARQDIGVGVRPMVQETLVGRPASGAWPSRRPTRFIPSVSVPEVKTIFALVRQRRESRDDAARTAS